MMRIYDLMNKGNAGENTIYVSPAKLTAQPDPEWIGDDGKPLQFPVRFRNGVALVDEKLGKLLVEKGYARKTRPLIRAA